MKKGIEVAHQFAPIGSKGRTVMCAYVKKAKGKLTLDEIKSALKESTGDDFYMLFIDAYHSPDEIQYDEDTEGDMATVYMASDLMGLTAEDYD